MTRQPRNFVLLVLFLFFSFCVKGQDSETTGTQTNLGIGVGLDYGGIGLKLNVLPNPKFAVFAGLGYNLQSLGYNVGMGYRILPDKKVCPVINLMYGYNRVIKVSGASSYDKTYYGVSLGGGIDIRSRKRPRNYTTLEVFLPINSSAFETDYKGLQNNPSIKIQSYSPVTLSIGFHFGL
jgi:hypothetical protein